jgi:hypothetical protein
MQPSIPAFSPEQIARGCLENGKEVIVLYVKEFREQLNRVRAAGHLGYLYTWAYLEEKDGLVLFVSWENKEEIAIMFSPNQHEVVEDMLDPKELIITALPIDVLVAAAQAAGKEFFDISGPVALLPEVIYKDPRVVPN